MEKYIEGNKEAWEEAFDKRDASWGANITERIQKEVYPFFEKEMVDILRTVDTEGKVIGQFCCNNGRELLSLVKSGKAANKEGDHLRMVESDRRFSINALFRLGFKRPIVDDAYLEKIIWALDSLSFFT